MDEKIENYQEVKDFYDFKVNPYTAILKTLDRLRDHSSEHAYIHLNEYKCFISREAPFNLDEVLNKIGELNYNEDIENQLRLCILHFFEKLDKNLKFLLNDINIEIELIIQLKKMIVFWVAKCQVIYLLMKAGMGLMMPFILQQCLAKSSQVQI